MKKRVIAVLLSMLLLISGGFFYQTISTQFDQSAYPPPGNLIDLGGYKLHMQLMGEGDITVVLDAGMGCFCLDWMLVQPEIAKFARVLSYDRAGYGWSDESPLLRTSRNIVSELHHMLQIAQVPPPYILVGHSFGGVNMRLYADTYPEEVAGIILVDSAHEQHFQKMPLWPRRVIERFMIQPPIATFGTAIGFMRLFTYFMDVRTMLKSLPEEAQSMYLAMISTTKYVKAVAQEFSYFSTINEPPRKVGDKPVSIISAGQRLISEERGYDLEFLDEITHVWKALQKDLLGVSSKSKQIIAEQSGHMISHQQPDLIIEATHQMIEELKNPDF